VLVLAMAGVLVFLAAASAVVVAMVVAHRTAQAAADLAALAGAQRVTQGDPCTTAARVAIANRARLTDCVITGRDVEVVVEVTGPHWLGQEADLVARSRAGPAGTSP
jgi:secretion/DNA translocation related TadE-like protein